MVGVGVVVVVVMKTSVSSEVDTPITTHFVILSKVVEFSLYLVLAPDYI